MRRATYLSRVTASEVIREIEALPPVEQAVVIRSAYRLDGERRLTGAELGALADRMAHTQDAVEALTLRDEILRGFCGEKDLVKTLLAPGQLAEGSELK